MPGITRIMVMAAVASLKRRAKAKRMKAWTTAGRTAGTARRHASGTTSDLRRPPMPDPDDPRPNPPSAGEQGASVQIEGDVPNLGPTLDPAGRDFGDSAGYGSGGSTRDYQEVVGENPVTVGRPNPLDAVIPPEQPGSQDEEQQSPDVSR
jgi:hypothetical protein